MKTVQKEVFEMCKASIVADSTRDAKVGDNLSLGISGHGIPQFRLNGDDPGRVTCIKDGDLLALGNIPLEVQSELDISSATTARFVEEPDDESDQLCLLSGRVVNLHELLPVGLALGEYCDIRVVVGGDVSSEESHVYGDMTTNDDKTLVDA